MRYCTRCILPDSRPGITLDGHGVCSGCRGHDDKLHRIDWRARAAAFDRLVAEVKERRADYDAIVPVSGGKDSWYQVIRCQEAGLKVLGVTWRTPGRTGIGQANLDRMIDRLGIDHIDHSVSPSVERRFMKAAFERKGASAIPMHMALFAIPIRLATQLGIPLIVWGENPQLEFGGADDDRLATDLDLDWVRRHGVTNDTQMEDWIGAEGLTAGDLAVYRLPDDQAFARGVRSIFLGSYFPWNSLDNAAVARDHGFAWQEGGARTGTWAFADIDCHFIAIHHYAKWVKFGISRTFDNLSQQIRYGTIDRDQAIATLRDLGPQEPAEDIARFCAFVGEDEGWFRRTLERFRNPAIWRKDAADRWTIPGFLVEDWPW